MLIWLFVVVLLGCVAMWKIGPDSKILFTPEKGFHVDIQKPESVSEPYVRPSLRALAQPAIDEWERKWKKETGEAWGTTNTLDPDVYQREKDRFEVTTHYFEPNGEVITMYTLGGRYGSPVVFSAEPYPTERIANEEVRVD